MTVLIVITGHPCTGKTTLGERLSADLRLPFFSKDNLKELFFEHLRWSNQDQERREERNNTIYALLYTITGSLLRVGQPCIIESNFESEKASKELEALRQRYPFVPFQVLCYSEGPVLVQRFQQRWQQGQRHPGHADPFIFQQIKDRLLQGKITPLELDGPLYEIDTTDFASLDYTKLLDTIQRFSQAHA
ncbi:putative kinase [Thermosporothrix hazakensis]|jgi:predicted kinase|uniref:ATP-binding protein n=2 Tax=Thermosporothrix TaxID=768650 RepID=A0A455SN35_9CHLR|nr:AAA family ATPase [Thermosporothrix hazakensis]PZW36353.1 putative kinase [Thermosporothrix hazakensis]BBH88818.1 hypothetical protein KTC_35690 [Thermosporothrix sp. COM3]GCE47002.1 hypothetical protein KTH_18710 [Thermosporothrix hazakensis]